MNINLPRQESTQLLGAEKVPDQLPDLEVTARPSISESWLVEVLLHRKDGKACEVAEFTRVIEAVGGVYVAPVEERLRVWVLELVQVPGHRRRLEAVGEVLREMRRLVRHNPYAVPMKDLRSLLRRASAACDGK